MNVMSINVTQGSGYRLNSFDASKPEVTFSFELDMIMNISVVNTNLYDMTVDSIILDVFLID
jgi:hypothetical protein